MRIPLMDVPVSSDTPEPDSRIVRDVSSDTPEPDSRIVRDVSSDTPRQRRYKKKLSRIVLDYRIEESEQIRQEATEMGVSVAEYIRRALQAYRQR